jgi:hypothetical protein
VQWHRWLRWLRLYRYARPGHGFEKAVDAESDLGVEVVDAARDVSVMLTSAWRGELVGNPTGFATGAAASGSAPSAAPDKGGSDKGAQEKSVEDALTPVAKRFSTDELAWLRRAQGFVATVVALLVNRHVRQFRVFVYPPRGWHS